MASSESKNPTILLAPTTPLWFHCLQWILVGAGIVFLWVFYLVLEDYLRAPAPAEAFRKAGLPLVQYRLEQRAWPEDFDFSKPPQGLAQYEFAKIWEKASADISVAGTWRFVRVGAEGKPAIQFEPTNVKDAAIFFSAVDKRIDDGRPDRGRFRVTGHTGSFTLPVE